MSCGKCTGHDLTIFGCNAFHFLIVVSRPIQLLLELCEITTESAYERKSAHSTQSTVVRSIVTSQNNIDLMDSHLSLDQLDAAPVKVNVKNCPTPSW